MPRSRERQRALGGDGFLAESSNWVRLGAAGACGAEERPASSVGSVPPSAHPPERLWTQSWAVRHQHRQTRHACQTFGGQILRSDRRIFGGLTDWWSLVVFDASVVCAAAAGTATECTR